VRRSLTVLTARGAARGGRSSAAAQLRRCAAAAAANAAREAALCPTPLGWHCAAAAAAATAGGAGASSSRCYSLSTGTGCTAFLPSGGDASVVALAAAAASGRSAGCCCVLCAAAARTGRRERSPHRAPGVRRAPRQPGRRRPSLLLCSEKEAPASVAAHARRGSLEHAPARWRPQCRTQGRPLAPGHQKGQGVCPVCGPASSALRARCCSLGASSSVLLARRCELGAARSALRARCCSLTTASSALRARRCDLALDAAARRGLVVLACSSALHHPCRACLSCKWQLLPWTTAAALREGLAGYGIAAGRPPRAGAPDPFWTRRGDFSAACRGSVSSRRC
jgi:hypothetical protein